MSDYKRALFQRGIPEYMHGGIIRWIEQGIEPGLFLQAVFSNNLMETFGQADDLNRNHILAYILYLHNDAPIGCWGSLQNYHEWHKKGGLKGLGYIDGVGED